MDLVGAAVDKTGSNEKKRKHPNAEEEEQQQEEEQEEEDKVSLGTASTPSHRGRSQILSHASHRVFPDLRSGKPHFPKSPLYFLCWREGLFRGAPNIRLGCFEML